MAVFDVPVAGLLLGLTALWAVVTLIWVALQLVRVRVPAPGYMVFPASVVATGIGGTVMALSDLPTGIEGLVTTAEATRSLWLGLMVAACGMALVALPLAAANVARAGPRSRWTPTHSLAAIPGAIGTLFGILSGPLSFAVGVIGTLAIGVVGLRIGRTQSDRARMAAGRGMVAFLSLAAPLCLGVAQGLHARMTWATLVYTAPFEDRPTLLVEVMDSAQLALFGNLGVAIGLCLAGLCSLIPVNRYLLNGRASAGSVLTLVMAVALAIASILVSLPLLQLEAVDEAELRGVALSKEGIQLSEVEDSEPWIPGQTVTVGVYWALVDGERATPFREGHVVEMDLEDGVPKGVFDRLASPARVTLEVDRRVGMLALAPVLEALKKADVESVCWVVRSRSGTFGCLPVSLVTSENAFTHILLEKEMVLIVGEEEAAEVPFTELAWRLSKTPAPRALHINRDVTTQRVVEALIELRKASKEPVVLVTE